MCDGDGSVITVWWRWCGEGCSNGGGEVMIQRSQFLKMSV